MNWPAVEALASELRSGKQRPTQLVEDCLSEIKNTKSYNAVLEINPEAKQRAKSLEKSAQKGKLFGVPFVAKDNFLTAETHTTAASNILKPFKAPYQATAIQRLEAEGAILLGKTNLDAFAHGSSTENSDFGPTKNPRDDSRVPGGSSGGSAAAMALGLAAFALGTDTGGSIRLPASFCGVVGLKPTYGLVSRYGVVAMASSTDVIGPLARSVEDAAYVLDVIARKDPMDSTTIDRDQQSYSKLRLSQKLTVGVIKEHLQAELEPAVKTQIENVMIQLRSAGIRVKEISIPQDELALAAYYIIVPAEISSNLARYDGIKYGHYTSKPTRDLIEFYEQTRTEGFNDENKRRIIVGTYVLSSGYYEAYYRKAQQVRTLLVKQYQQAFEQADVLLGPTAATTAFKLGGKPDPLSMYLTDIMTVAANLVGIPAISLPAGSANGLPVGLQLMAPQRQERRLLGLASHLQTLLTEDTK